MLCESLPVCTLGDLEEDLESGQAIACLAGPIVLDAVTLTDACALLVPGAINVSAQVAVSVLGTTMRFPVEGQHPIGSDLQDRISGLDGLSAFAAVRNGTVGALARYEHDDIREAFGLQWLSLSNLQLEVCTRHVPQPCPHDQT